MPIVVTRNPAAGQHCDGCKERRSVLAWTVNSTDGSVGGWQARGTVHLCRACLLDAADGLEGKRFIKVISETLKAANITVPHNASFDDLSQLLADNDLEYPGEGEGGTPPAPAPPAVDKAPTPIEAARQRADEAGVPFVPTMNTAAIDKRIAMWAKADELGIDLADELTNNEADEVLANSRAASG